jgi:hypothetical protein
VKGQDYKDEVMVTYHRASVFGLFTDPEKKIESFGSLIAWDKETAMSISDLRPYYTYQGTFEGYLKEGVYVLNLNEEQEFEEIAKADEEITNNAAVKYISTSQRKIHTLASMEDYKAPLKTENIIVKGRISDIRKIKMGDKGRSSGGIVLSSSEPGSMNTLNVSWFDNAEMTTKYAQRSTVYVGCSVSKKKDATYFNGDYIIPIHARPGVRNVAPPQLED